LQDFAREAATITDAVSAASSATPRQLAYPIDNLRVSFMAPALAHNMSFNKPASAWPKAQAFIINRRI
jgi:hypothetical protein